MTAIEPSGTAEIMQLSRRIRAVMRCCFTPTAVLAATLILTMGARTDQARASTINPNASKIALADSSGSTVVANYRLTVSGGLPVPDANIAGPQVVAMVVPAGGVAPPTNADGSQGSPLTVLGDSSGFDASQLVVALKDATGSAGEPEQLLGLVFFGKGFDASGSLHFGLSIDRALAANPPKLVSTTPGVTITADAVPPPDTGSGGGTTTPPAENVPEPVSVILWSAVAVIAAFRGRARALKTARRDAA
jgi:hypothetical protein